MFKYTGFSRSPAKGGPVESGPSAFFHAAITLSYFY
jgi:hypothetical protein